MRDRHASHFRERPLTASERVELPIIFETGGDLSFHEAGLSFSAANEIDIGMAKLLIAKKRGLGNYVVVRLDNENWNRYYRFDGRQWCIAVYDDQPIQRDHQTLVKLVVISFAAEKDNPAS